MSNNDLFDFRSYAEILEPPYNEFSYVKEDAKNFVGDRYYNSKTYDKELIEYAIDNFLIAYAFFKKSYDLTSKNIEIDMEVKLNKKDRDSLPEKYDILFRRGDINHLLGLNHASFKGELPPLFDKWLSTKNYYIRPDNLLDILYEFFKTNKKAIIEFDSNPRNEKITKFNWDKISEKAFTFLNLGLLKDRVPGPRPGLDTGAYELFKKDNDNYALRRKSLLIDNINGRRVPYGYIYILLKFVHRPNGDYYFQPISIMNESMDEISRKRNNDYLTRNGYRPHSIPNFGVHTLIGKKNREMNQNKDDSVTL